MHQKLDRPTNRRLI